ILCRLSAEGVDLFRPVIEQTGFLPTLLCCPFHGVPLGQFMDTYRVFCNSAHKADVESLEYARDYLDNPERYLRGLSGVDLARLGTGLHPSGTAQRPLTVGGMARIKRAISMAGPRTAGAVAPSAVRSTIAGAVPRACSSKRASSCSSPGGLGPSIRN